MISARTTGTAAANISVAISIESMIPKFFNMNKIDSSIVLLIAQIDIVMAVIEITAIEMLMAIPICSV